MGYGIDPPYLVKLLQDRLQAQQQGLWLISGPDPATGADRIVLAARVDHPSDEPGLSKPLSTRTQSIVYACGTPVDIKVYVNEDPEGERLL